MSIPNQIVIDSSTNVVDIQTNDNQLYITSNVTNTEITVTQPVTTVIQVATQGPQGPQGPQGETGVSNQITTGSITASVNIGTDTFKVQSGSSTFLYVSSSGRVGIGTTTPTNTLQVVGSVIATTFTGSLFGTASNAQTALFITPTGTNAFVQGGNSFGENAILGTNNDNTSLQFKTAGENRVIIDSSGNVGIGTTTPTNTLQIVGDSTFQNILFDTDNTYDIGTEETRARNIWSSYIFGMASNASTASYAQTASFITPTGTNAFVQGGNSFGTAAVLGTNDNQSLHFETSGSVRMTISSSNVGIGTTTPTNTLQVKGDSSLQNIVYDTNNTYDIGTSERRARDIWANNNITGVGGFFNNLRTYFTSSIGPNDFTANAHLHISGASSANMLRISSPSSANILFVSGSGNVGIGTATPSAQLHVSGSTNIPLRVQNPATTLMQISSSTVNSGSIVFFGTAPNSGFDIDVQGTGAANAGSVRIAGNGTVYSFISQGSIVRSITGNAEMFSMVMGGTSPTDIQNPLRIQFNANQNSLSGSGYTVLRVNATHATTAGTGSKLLQTWEFAGVQRSVVNITGSIGVGITTPSASIHISSSLGLAPMLTITPHHPLPTTNVPTGTFMVSASTTPKPFFWDGSSWNALY
jgi:hypothetical protein